MVLNNTLPTISVRIILNKALQFKSVHLHTQHHQRPLCFLVDKLRCILPLHHFHFGLPPQHYRLPISHLDQSPGQLQHFHRGLVIKWMCAFLWMMQFKVCLGQHPCPVSSPLPPLLSSSSVCREVHIIFLASTGMKSLKRQTGLCYTEIKAWFCVVAWRTRRPSSSPPDWSDYLFKVRWH